MSHTSIVDAQIALHEGLPFNKKASLSKSMSFAPTTKEQLDFELQKGLDSIKNGRTLTSDEVDMLLNIEFGI